MPAAAAAAKLELRRGLLLLSTHARQGPRLATADLRGLFGFLGRTEGGGIRLGKTATEYAYDDADYDEKAWAYEEDEDDGMTNAKKRALPGGQQQGSKKRKVEGSGQKFYAVRVGRIPGVYTEYSQCQAQTAGFRGAVCRWRAHSRIARDDKGQEANTRCAVKSFPSRADAEDFAAGRAVQPAHDEPARFYAVAVGNPTGIFSDWADASQAIKGVKGPKYKRFATRAEAVEYIREYGSAQALAAVGGAAAGAGAAAGKSKKEVKQEAVSDSSAAEGEEEDDDGAGTLRIWTDGSSRANGRVGARAGLGVFFGQGDPRNVSEPLRGMPQTNQRAELMAMQRALEVAPRTQAVEIISDSQYSINCVTQWAKSWRAKGWKTAMGDEVKNRDIIEAVLALIDGRKAEGAPTAFSWVKGHNKDPGNTAADMLAVRGASM